MTNQQINDAIGKHIFGFKEPSVSPSYSDVLESAWRVVHKLRQQDKAFSIGSIRYHQKDKPKWEWNAHFEWFEDTEYHHEFHNDISAPKAICLAALKAVGYELKEDQKK